MRICIIWKVIQKCYRNKYHSVSGQPLDVRSVHPSDPTKKTVPYRPFFIFYFSSIWLLAMFTKFPRPSAAVRFLTLLSRSPFGGFLGEDEAHQHALHHWPTHQKWGNYSGWSRNEAIITMNASHVLTRFYSSIHPEVWSPTWPTSLRSADLCGEWQEPFYSTRHGPEQVSWHSTAIHSRLVTIENRDNFLKLLKAFYGCGGQFHKIADRHYEGELDGVKRERWTADQLQPISWQMGGKGWNKRLLGVWVQRKQTSNIAKKEQCQEDWFKTMPNHVCPQPSSYHDSMQCLKQHPDVSTWM